VATSPIVVTAHRRESHGAPLRRIYAAARELACRCDRRVLVALHRNPAVEAAIESELDDGDGVDVVDPIAYPDFVALLRDAALVLTDSGGVQEEASFLGRPVLLLRDHTERPEGLASGHARLVGTDAAAIVTAALEALEGGPDEAAPGPGACPYGDGHSAPRIVRVLEDQLEGGRAGPVEPHA
jgi:UDP-N-acetylglucosamine 2-epimerase (non-hydrolysing)